MARNPSPWIGGTTFVGLDFYANIGKILEQLVAAFNERRIKFGGAPRTFHSADGEMGAPQAVNFSGMPYSEIPQTLDDIESAIAALLADNMWVDRDDLDTQYTTFAQLAIDATGSPSRPQAPRTAHTLWDFYVDIYGKLLVVKAVTVPSGGDPPSSPGIRWGLGSSTSNQTAWNDMLNNSQDGGGFDGRIVFGTSGAPLSFSWIIFQETPIDYDFGLPSGGVVVRDQLTMERFSTGAFLGVTDPSHTFELVINGSPVHTETIGDAEQSLVTETRSSAPFLGLSPQSGDFTIKAQHRLLGATPKWNTTFEGEVLMFLSGEHEAQIWVDYKLDLSWW